MISGGGTGGHVYPLLAIAEALNPPAGEGEPSVLSGEDAVGGDVQGEHVDVLYVGSPDGMEVSLLARTDLPYRAVDSAPVKGVTPWRLLLNVHHLWRGYRQSLRLLVEWPADVVLVSGAYVSVPVSLAASRRHIPVMIYLPDREPGLAVRFLSRFADRVAVSFEAVRQAFPAAQRHKVWVSGYPVRAALLEADRAMGYDVLDLDPSLKTLLVLGGSRGARAINRALLAIVGRLVAHCQVVHITGQLDWPQISEEKDRLLAEMPIQYRTRYRAYPYLHEELAPAMAAADLVVARAGAATLAEFPAVGLPSILVPYPYSGQHQGANADFMVAHGAAVRIDDTDLDTQLEPTVIRLLGDEQALERMKAGARALARPDAARRLAQELCRLSERCSLSGADSSGLQRQSHAGGLERAEQGERETR